MSDNNIKNDTLSENEKDILAEDVDIIDEEQAPEGPFRSPSDPEDSDSKEYLEAPFSYGVSGNESVVLSNGSLQYTVTDFSLPGRNGFDLTITRKYDSDTSNLFDVAPKYKDINSFSTTKRDNSHFRRAYGLGYGWQFVLPSVEITPSSERDSHFSYTPTLHLADGRAFVIEKSKLKDYPQTDVTVSETTGNISHPVRTEITKQYHLTVSYKEGNKDYFQKRLDSSGNLNSYTLIAQTDRFNNALFFNMTDFGGMTITDTWGRDISLTVSGNTMKWTLPDNSSVVYERDGTNKLVSVTDQCARITAYDYHDPEVYAAVCKFASSSYGDNTNLSFPYMLLSKITYPTGFVSQYHFDTTPAKWKTGSYGGYKQFFPLTQRKDIENNSEYNITDYTYTLSSDNKYFAYSEVSKLNNITEKHSWSDKGLLISKEVKHSNMLASSGIYTYGTVSTAGDYKLLTKSVEKTYSLQFQGRYTEKETIYTYSSDKKADVIKIEENYPDDPSLNNETLMTYGSYSILTGKTVMKDDATTIKEQHTLSSSLSDKVVEYSKVYENNVLKEKTQFIYGSGSESFLIKEKRRYIGSSNNLESSDEYISEYYLYDETQYTHASTGTSIINIFDADGNPTDSITTSVTYDVMGRAITTTDALSNVTSFKYDNLGRKLLETYPDSSKKKWLYFDSENVIVEIDELGFITRYEYTPSGKMSKVYLCNRILPKQDDILTEVYLYDNLMRVAEEKVYDEKGNVLTQTGYVYDSYDRVLSKHISSPKDPSIDILTSTEYYDLFIDSKEPGVKYNKTVTVTAGEEGAPDIISSSLSDILGRTIKDYSDKSLKGIYTYDKLGNKLSVTDANGNTSFNTYDYASRVISTVNTIGGAPLESRTEYDSLGNKRYSWDCKNQKTEYIFFKCPFGEGEVMP